MRKRHHIKGLFMTALVLGLVTAGCGGSGMSGNADAVRILAECTRKVTTVKSWKSSCSIASTGSNPDWNMNASTETQLDIVDPNCLRGYKVLKAEGTEIDWFLEDGYIYMCSSGLGWIKTSYENKGGVLTDSPAYDLRLASHAEQARIVSDSGSTYKIAFNVSPENLPRSVENSSDETQSGARKYLKTSVILTIEKGALYIRESRLACSLNSPTEGSLNATIRTVYSDYNQPVVVALPADAASAREASVSAAEAMSFGAEGIPGLGL